MKKQIVYHLDGPLAESKSYLDVTKAGSDRIGIRKLLPDGNNYPAREARAAVRRPRETKPPTAGIAACSVSL